MVQWYDSCCFDTGVAEYPLSYCRALILLFSVAVEASRCNGAANLIPYPGGTATIDSSWM